MAMLIPIIFLAFVVLFPEAHTLSCLQCDNVPKPRYCKAVTECFDDEVCGVEKVTDSFEAELYNVGCVKKSKCMSSNDTNHCMECCSSNLCNADGCGETGYPHTRGPVCYNCPLNTNPKFCHSIDICGSGEVCMFDARREFGDIIFSSRCSNVHVCSEGITHETAIVGRDAGVSDTRNVDTRSVTEHVCRQCCDMDLCNTACNGSTLRGPCDSMPCVHGQCHEEHGDYFCVCDQGFVGKQCNISIRHCQSNPCANGTCYDIQDDYFCACDKGYEGKDCNRATSHCQSNPCHHGKCYDGVDDYVCVCDKGYGGKQCSAIHDCYNLQRTLTNKTGVYTITLWKSKKVIDVFCDMDTDNGGWTVFQRRFNGSVNFTRTFSEYEKGFGSLFGEFWLGLEFIQEMVAEGTTELRLDLTAANGVQAYEVFQNFRLAESPLYTLHIDKGSGTAGDNNGLSFNSGQNFYSYDRDTSLCAARDKGGWWYKNCAFANLNGEYITPGTVSSSHSGEGGFTYRDFQGYKALKESKMMFRRV